jgi:hypothetical protein
MTLADPVHMGWTARLRLAILGTAVMLGALAGARVAVLTPPMYSSSALVIVPATQQIYAQALIAASDPVLQAASLNGPLSLEQLTHQVQVEVASSRALVITATANRAADAEGAARAVAFSYWAYATHQRDPVPVVVAYSATPAVGESLGAWVAEISALSALVAAALCLVGTVFLGRIMRRPESLSFGLFAR